MGIIFSCAWRNLWRNKRRTLLTAGAIAFSTLLLVCWVPIQFGAYDIMINASLRVLPGHAQIQMAGYQDKPDIRNVITGAEALASRIRQDNNIYQGVAVRAQGFALLSSGNRSYGAQVMGVQAKFEGHVSSIPGLIVQGRFLNSANANEIVLGRALADNLKVKPGDEITLLGSAKDGSVAAAILTLVGVFESGSKDIDRQMAEIGLTSFQNIFSLADSAHVIAVLGHSLQQQPVLLTNLKQMIAGHRELNVLAWDDLLPGMKEAVEVDKSFGFVFYGILIAVLVFSILNTFLMSVLERTKEFGLMLALGTPPNRIAQLLILESSILTLLGILTGILIGSALVYWAHLVGIHYPGIEELAEQFNLPDLSRIYPQMKLSNFLLGPVCIFIFTNLAAAIPVLRIYKLKPVEAMRTL